MERRFQCYMPFTNHTQYRGRAGEHNNTMQKIIGASLSAPHIYRTAVQNVYVPSVCPSGIQFGPAKGPVKHVMRVLNVRPASKGSKVNNIALKMATFNFTL